MLKSKSERTYSLFDYHLRLIEYFIHSRKPVSIDVLVGTIDLRSGGQRYNVRKTYIHKGYFTPRFAHDIALIRLDEKITFDDKVQPIPLYPHKIDQNLRLQLSKFHILIRGYGCLSES